MEYGVLWQTENAGVPALYNGGLPAEFIRVVPVKKPWFSKIKTISWSDFFQYEKNKMVVYRITPHSSVSNNNKRLFKAIHKMYEMYESVGSRIERDRFKFHYREKDSFWFDVIFRQVKGKKQVEFYISTTEFQAEKLKRKIENKMNVTMVKTDIKNLEIPVENTIIQEMKYLNHDIFSLNTNSTEQKTPISGIMNAVDELTYDGDFARLSICNEVVSRSNWLKNASWAVEKLNKGKVPQRANLSPKKAINASKTFFAAIINEVNDVLTDTFNAIQNSFFKSEKKFEDKKVIEKAYKIEDEIHAKNRSGASLEKLNQGVFKSHIRIASHSADRLTRDTIGETIATAFADLSENNELHGVKIKINGRRIEVIEEMNSLRLGKITKANGNVNLVSCDEMNKLIQMPTAEIQRRYDEELSVKTRVETDLPAPVRNENGILLGKSEQKENEIPAYLPCDNPDTLYSGYTFIGKQGAGKDTAAQNFVYEGSKKGISFVIPDWICEQGHRGLADGVRDLLPPEKIIDIDFGNEEYIPPLDLTEVISKLGRKGASRFADEMIDFMELEGLARSQRYLTEASKSSGGSLYNIKRIIEDDGYRLQRIQELIEEGNIRLANDLIQWGTNEELGNKADAILNRLNMFFGNDTLFDIFSQPPKKELDFEKWMKEGKVIILRIPKRKLGALAAKTLAHWITLKVLMTRMLMDIEDKERGCFILFNEPEQVETRGLAELMGRIATEGRKERLGSIFAFHHWDKLPDYLQDNLIAGGVNQFLFANDHKKTFEKAKERLHPTFTVEEALQTPKEYAICILNTKEPLPAFLLHMSPPVPKDKRYDNSFLTKKHARLYGRKWGDLQKVVI